LTLAKKNDVMNKRLATASIIIIILVFIGYIVSDVALRKDIRQVNFEKSDSVGPADMWIVTKIFEQKEGQLNAVAVSENGNIFMGGELFVSCYDPGFNLLWEYKTEMPVTALAVSGNNLYAAAQGNILVLNIRGEKVDEWGPFEDKSIITSLSANDSYLAVADAANKTVFVLDKNGVLKALIGKSEEPFIIPSHFFDVALGDDSNLYIANAGRWRIEKRNTDGKILNSFGASGTDPDAFCGCCNPAHFALIPDGFVTAEKGINRIKILDNNGKFVEFVSAVNDFIASVPLDVASADGKLIYAANPADSKLYVFKRRSPTTP
jgi:outer membrane protein assembly factor BamB